MSCSGDGIIVGDVVGFSLSSQVLDKGGLIDRNSFVGLFRVITDENGDEKEIPIFAGSISNYTIKSGVINFTAEDIISFTDNNYSMTASESGTSADDISLPIGEQYKQAEELLSMYSGLGITIPKTGASGFYTSETGWSIRELFSNCAIWDGKNYYVDHSKSTLYSQEIVDGFGNYIYVSENQHSEVSISSTDVKINCVQVSDKDNSNPIILTDGITYEDYGIFRYYGNEEPTPAGTKSFICCFIDKTNKDSCMAKSILNHSNGCSFACDNILFDALQPPYTQLHFAELGSNQPAFYIMQANYRVTGNGLIASVSGTTKSASDSEFIGQTQSSLQKRVLLNTNYGFVNISAREGIFWDDSDVKEATDSG